MINTYIYKKYNDIFNFVDNVPNSKKNKICIPIKCHGLQMKNELKFNDYCFGCLSCILNNPKLKNKFFEKWESDLNYYKKNSFFNGELIDPFEGPVILNRNKGYKNLKEFTKTNETENIQPWASSLLIGSAFNNARISLEINIPYGNDDRDKRLDIGAISNNYFLGLEAKTSLESAINENERFIEQYLKYSEKIKKACIQNNIDHNLLILFGGKESDLLPPNNINSTGKIGNLSERFYDIIKKHKIKFISANALWGLSLYNLILGPNFSWDIFIKNIFNNNTFGLISAGKIINTDNKFEVASINTKDLQIKTCF